MRIFKSIVAIALVISLCFTTPQISVFATQIASSKSSQAQSQEFIYPVNKDAKIDNEYKKEPLLKLPDVSNDNQNDENHGTPIAINEYSKIYKTGDNAYQTVYTTVPNTYKDSFGKQQEIDTTLVKKNEFFGEEYFTSNANSLAVKLPLSIDKGDGVTYSKDGVSIKMIPLEGDYTKIAVKDNAVLYNNVFDGIDVQYTSLETSIKEDIILNKYVNKNEFKYQLQADNVDVRLENGVINIYKWNNNTPVMSLTAPLMTDSVGNMNENVKLSLEKKLGNNYITVTADKDWLSSSERVYPVKIDPNVTIPASNVTVITTSEYRGTYAGKSYGYVGSLSGDEIGVPGADLGKTRMYMKVNADLSSIPSEARIDNATLQVYQYTRPGGNNGEIFTSYYLQDNWNPATINWANSLGLSKEPSGDGCTSGSNIGFHSFDAKTAVNNWFSGSSSNYGFVITAANEILTGAAFFTPLSNLQIISHIP